MYVCTYCVPVFDIMKYVCISTKKTSRYAPRRCPRSQTPRRRAERPPCLRSQRWQRQVRNHCNNRHHVTVHEDRHKADTQKRLPCQRHRRWTWWVRCLDKKTTMPLPPVVAKEATLPKCKTPLTNTTSTMPPSTKLGTTSNIDDAWKDHHATAAHTCTSYNILASCRYIHLFLLKRKTLQQ
jgi:hypothetical protein